MNHLFYHVTTLDCLSSIQSQGMIPQIGPRSLMIHENVDQIYLFNTYADLETALSSWLGDLWEDDVPLVIFEVRLNLDDPALAYQKGTMHYESFYRARISPDRIKMITMI